jgi:DNA-binding response OmpR family regulator
MTMANILVVEDEERVALSIERSLHKEHQVRVAIDAFEANKIARRMNPELIILDVMMPSMNGLDLCRQLRSDPLLSSVPILFLTAKGRTEDKLKGLEAGADDYMTKPFATQELLSRIKRLLSRQTCEPT